MDSGETSPLVSIAGSESFSDYRSVPPEDLFPVKKMSATELIYASRKALESRDAVRVQVYLKQLRTLLQHPGELSHVMDMDFRALLQSCFSSSLESVGLAALSVLTESLHGLSQCNVFKRNLGLVKIVLRLIKLDVILAASTVNLLVFAFDNLAWWCSHSRDHREVFLSVFPMQLIDEIYAPDLSLNIFTAYLGLISSILRGGPGQSEVLPTSLRIFARALRHVQYGNLCDVAEPICNALIDVVENFHDENPVEEVLDSRIASALVRHIMAVPTYIIPGSCTTKCLNPMMKLFVSFLASTEEHCQRFVDQGILSAIEVCLAGPRTETCRFACMALTNIFAYSPYSIEYALHSTLAEHLFLLRDTPDTSMRKEALKATSNFFSRASSAQVTSMVDKDFIPRIVKLLRSPHADVMQNGLVCLLAVIGTTHYNDAARLPRLHELLAKNDVEKLSEMLKFHRIKEIRLSAIAVHDFMTTYIDGGTKSGAEAEARWPQINTRVTQSMLTSVVSLDTV